VGKRSRGRSSQAWFYRKAYLLGNSRTPTNENAVPQPEYPYRRHPDFTYAVVQARSPESPRNDTASVCALENGSWLVVWHKYRAEALQSTHSGSSDFGRCDIAAKISSDQGEIWSEERILVEADPDDNNVQAPALRRLRNGDILLNCLRGHAGGDSSSMCVFRSQNNGASFEFFSKLWERSDGQWLQGGASSLLELQSGRLLIPCHSGTGDQGGQHNVVHCWFSDNSGLTWRRNSAPVDLPMRGAMEASVTELPDGELLMSLRTQLGAVFLARSVDQGESWSLPQTTGQRAPESCTCIRAVPDTELLILLWNDAEFNPEHHHFGVRRPLSLAISNDRGATWEKRADIVADTGLNFTDLGCDFVDPSRAVSTYMVHGPDQQTERQGQWGWTDPEYMDLHTAVINTNWLLDS
jgi:sialidase-1